MLNAQMLRNTEYDNDDLRSNYDRELVHLAVAEAEIKHGLHKKNGDFVRNFINEQKFYIKTGNGVSEKYYENTEALPIYGLGQGIAWAGPAWIIASNTIVNAKKSKCVGMIFRDPITNTIVEKMQDMFVDDRAAGCNTTMENRTILQQAEHNFQDHVDLVNVTGGDIALDKCDFYHVEYIFENGEAVVVGMEKQQSKYVSRTLRVEDWFKSCN